MQSSASSSSSVKTGLSAISPHQSASSPCTSNMGEGARLTEFMPTLQKEDHYQASQHSSTKESIKIMPSLKSEVHSQMPTNSSTRAENRPGFDISTTEVEFDSDSDPESSQSKLAAIKPKRQSPRRSFPSKKPEIMVFRPTWDEFKDFNNYIKHMESQGAHLAGIAKVIPPPEYKPRQSGCYDNIDLDMEPVRQNIIGKAGVYWSIFEKTKTFMTVKQFRCLAESKKYAPPISTHFEDIEREFWKYIAYKAPLYGADVSGSLTDRDYPYWNYNKLGSILDIIQTELKCNIYGVNSPYLYFGMWKAAFAWHTEDLDLYSINYLHYGAPKTWYAIPPANAKRFEELAAELFPVLYSHCNAFLRHKSTFISPKELTTNLVPFNRIAQYEGEIIITFPYGYHSGFNHGYNIAESVNFATPRWVEYGKRAQLCRCQSDSVRIDMEPFVRRFQPERYQLWIEGKDFGRHPEQPHGRLKAAPKRRIPVAKSEIKSPKKRFMWSEMAPRHTRKYPGTGKQGTK